jgi:hypothetical protein
MRIDNLEISILFTIQASEPAIEISVSAHELIP